MNVSCTAGCSEFRVHADPHFVVCIKCGEVYLKNQVNMSINEEYEFEKDGGFDHLST